MMPRTLPVYDGGYNTKEVERGNCRVEEGWSSGVKYIGGRLTEGERADIISCLLRYLEESRMSQVHLEITHCSQ